VASLQSVAPIQRFGGGFEYNPCNNKSFAVSNFTQGKITIVNDSYSSTILHWLSRSNPSFAIRHVSRPSSVIGTTRGRVRDENQDIAAVAIYDHLNSAESFRACVVCDGVGGMEQGAQCASEAASSFLAHLISTAAISSRSQRLRDAVEHANQTVYSQHRERGGTTIAAILWTTTGLTAAAVGDTRIYKQSESGNLVKLTIDDTIAGRLAALGQSLGQRGGGPFGHHLAQFVGQRSAVTPQIFESNSLLSDMGKGRSGILLTTDGVHRIGDDVFQAIARNASSARELMQHLISVSEWMGGSDNATGLYLSLNESAALHQPSRQQFGLTLQDAYGELLVMNMARESSAMLRQPERPSKYLAPSIEKLMPERRKGNAKSKRKSKRKSSKSDASPRQAELKIRVTEHSE
jgi:PPM family protein phosphatase